MRSLEVNPGEVIGFEDYFFFAGEGWVKKKEKGELN